MLEVAYRHEEEIRDKLMDTWYDPHYMFFHNRPFRDQFKLPDQEGDWNYRCFASIDDYDRVIGFIGFSINRTHDLVENIEIINFSMNPKNKLVFAIDVAKAIDDIFRVYNFRKVEFYVIIGNPVEKTYDRLVKKYGGNIIGIKHKAVKLLDMNYYDIKEYEIFREDYLAATENIKDRIRRMYANN